MQHLPLFDSDLGPASTDRGTEHAIPPPPPSGRRPTPDAGTGYDEASPESLTEHLHLVHGVVARLARRLPANVLRDDLLAAGVFGLVVALRRNGGAQGPTFEGYAKMRIRGAVFDELRAQDWLSRRARDRARAQKAAGGTGAAFVSLEDAGIDTVASDPADGCPAAAAEAKSQSRALSRAMSHLPERERRIVAMHYFEGAKLKEIGAHLGVSEPRVSQLHARALSQLRQLLEPTRAA